jgi:hypothetical protein
MTAAVLEKGGNGTTLVDDQQVAQGRIDRIIRASLSLDETFDMGEDTATPAVDDYGRRALQPHRQVEQGGPSLLAKAR